MSILLSNGDGTFTTGTALNVGASSFPHLVAVGDFNGDGKVDLAVVSNTLTTGKVSIWLGNGDGTFSAGATYTIPLAGEAQVSPSGIAVGDFNGDGNLDIAVSDATSDYVTVLLGNGNGTFTAAAGVTVYSFPTIPNCDPCSDITSIRTADINGDGKLDLIVANQYDMMSQTLIGNGDGTFSNGDQGVSGQWDSLVDLIPADFAKNGTVNVAMDTLGGGLWVTGSPGYLYGNGDMFGAMAIGDFDNDGNLDLAVQADGTISIFLGNGDSTFNFEPGDSPVIPDVSGSIAVGDFNGDGLQDIAITNVGFPGTVSIFLNKGPAATATSTTASANPIVYGQPLTLTAEVAHNGDGSTPITGTVTFYNSGTAVGSAPVNSTSTTNLLRFSQQLANKNAWTNVGIGVAAVGGFDAPDGTQTATKITFPASAGCCLNYWQDTSTPFVGGQTYTYSVWLRSSSPTTVIQTLRNNPYTWESDNYPTIGTTWKRYSVTASAPGGNLSAGFYVSGTAAPTTIYAWGAQVEEANSPGPYVPTGAVSETASSALASYASPNMPVGSYPFTAKYNGNSFWAASTSPVLMEDVTPAVLTVTANNASRPYDTANPAFTAAYAGFVNGDTSAVLSGAPSLTTTATLLSSPGSYPITSAAGTLSAANYTFSFDNGTLTVGTITLIPGVTFTLTSSANPSTYGQSVTFTATIPPAATGTMQFLENGVAMGAPVAVSGGVATYTTSVLTAGTQAITAQYSGDSNYSPATSLTVNQVVNKVTSVLSVVASLNPSVFGNSVTYTLTVAGSGTVPTGTVTLTLGGTTLLPATVLNGAGQATYTTSTLPTGADTLTLSYSGDSNYY